jgi:rhodanese-related sulfurtransferase
MEQIAPEILRDWLEDLEVYILDVRSPRAWEASRVKIPGAHRFDPHQPVETWAAKIPKDKKVVAY